MSLRDMMADIDSTKGPDVESTYLDRALTKEEGAAMAESQAVELEISPEPEGIEPEIDEEPEVGETEGPQLPETAAIGDELELDPDEPERDKEIEAIESDSPDERLDEPAPERGGPSSGGGGSAPNESVPVLPANADAGPAPQVLTQKSESVPAKPASTPAAKTTDGESSDRVSAERKSDQRDEIQAAKSSTSTGGGGGGPLPRAGFKLTEDRSQLQIRNLPDELTAELRNRIIAAAQREKGATEDEARAFARRLSLSSLVSAFLMAGLDKRLDADASTSLATDLFRSQDPLLGAAVDRIEKVQEAQDKGLELTNYLTAQSRAQEKTLDVIEQLLAYSVADRTENFLRGSHDIHKAPIAHKDAVFMRDRARDETKRHQQIEVRAEGRPLR